MLASVTTLAVAGTKPAAAQSRDALTRMGGLFVSAYAGGATYTDLQRSRVSAVRIQPPRTPPVEFTRRLSSETSVALAVAAGYWFNASWGFRLHAGIAPSRLEIIVAEREGVLPKDTTLAPRAPFARLNIWSYDAALLFRAPITPRGRVAPYGLIGGGLLRYSVVGKEPLPLEAVPAFADGSVNRSAAVIGLGAIVPLQRRNLALTFELTSHLSRTAVERAAYSTVAEGDSIAIGSQESNPGGEGRINIAGQLRLLIGVTWLSR